MSRASCLSLFSVLSLVWIASGPAHGDVDVPKPGQWSGGAGVGFLTNTPDGVAEFGIKGHADYFWTSSFSVGALAQYAGVGNDFVFGLSAQAKYWWDIPGSGNRAKLVIQGGLGFVRAGIEDDDTGVAFTDGSFLIPVGIGVDYALSRRIALTAEVLVNFTSLGEHARGEDGREVDLHTNVMPGFYLGVRF
jgi:Outer membrane protein beta-barrel domain